MMKAKKSLGQNFLTSKRALDKIIEAGDLQPDENILEIGPGKGALTETLLKKNIRLFAVEKDDNLIPLLEKKFEKEINSGQLTIIHGDILELEPEKIFSTAPKECPPYKLIANIPYYITGALFKKFLGAGCQPKHAVLLVQKEVAERIVAHNGKESILSLSVKAYGTPRYIETVKAGSFVPAPSVDSAILQISNVSKKFFTEAGISEKMFFEILKAGFAGKRKFLTGNLKKFFAAHPEILKNKTPEEFYKEAGIAPKARAEDISLYGWQRLAASLPKNF